MTSDARAMHLALSIDPLAPDMGGIGRYTLELARRLPSRPDVASLKLWRQGNWFTDPAPFLLAETPQARSRLPRWLRKARSNRSLRTRLFHGTNYFLPERAEGGVVTVHDLSVFLQPETHPVERVRFFLDNVPASVARAGAVITSCDTIRTEVIDFFGLPADRVTTIALGVSSMFRPHATAELVPILARYGLRPGGYALSVATLEPRKRFPDLLMAWRALPPDIRRRTPLAIVGGAGWLSDAIHQQIEAGVADGWVHKLGYVAEADLPALYAGSALFVYPSIYEGFGLPPIEAMACGVPVVVSNASCMPEVTKGAAMLVDPSDTADFAQRLSRALTDEAWRTTAIVQGRLVADGYSWERCTDRTAAVYRSLVASRR